jgi:hypothetical protein
MKYRILFLFAILISACAEENLKNISTVEAYKKYGQLVSNKLFYAFPEVQENPLKWFDSIPETKLKNPVGHGSFSLSARPGEVFVYQIGVWATNGDVSDLKVEFSDLKGKSRVISSSKMTCYNLGGTDFRGNAFKKQINIPRGRIQDLWIGINLDSIFNGTYRGLVTILSGSEKQVLPISLNVSGNQVSNHGYNEGSHMSRLNWLNSTVGTDENVTKGFTPIDAEGNRLTILGRTMEIAGNGLPSSIVSYFGPSNQSLLDKGAPIVREPFRFIIEKWNGEFVSLVPGKLAFIEKTPSKIVWKVLNTSTDFDLDVTGQMEFDGFIRYSLKLTSKSISKIKDIRLEIPVEKKKARYMMGLGHEGGIRPSEWRWKWNISRNQDMLWVGSVNGGLRVKFKAENYVRPLINVYYKFGQLKLPASWGNEGKGGVDVTKRNDKVIMDAYSGEREMKSGDALNFNFELLITPFKVIDRHIKFGDRYYHGGGTNTSVKVDSARKYGANILNIHHAEDIYPFINYPYLDANIKEFIQLVNQTHKQNIRLKVYYTTREFTKNLPEFWAFNSLNGEIVFPGPGNSSKTVINPNGPKDWYIKNLRENYIPAWFNEIKEGKFKGETDLSVITTPDSRLNNFYVAGLNWMVQNIGIDGVYIDDSALDRYTLMRARKIIDLYRPEGRMDLHSWNHFNEWAGFASCLNLYMDLLPYLDLLWIGEGRDYNRAPDHWLIEVSGIPFGLPGQMLEGGGNPWRGMVYGITNRPGWVGNSPAGLWKFWDEYKIENKIMEGYWEEEAPVIVSNSSVKASVYKGDGESIISVANWTDRQQVASVKVAWSKLGMDPALTDIFIPDIQGFQSGQKSISLEKITIPGKEGYLIVLRKKSNKNKYHEKKYIINS